jgi:hypothetical protein
MANEQLEAAAKAYIENKNPFVKGSPEIIMRKHWLIEFMVGFHASMIAAEREAAVAENRLRDAVLNAAKCVIDSAETSFDGDETLTTVDPDYLDALADYINQLRASPQVTDTAAIQRNESGGSEPAQGGDGAPTYENELDTMEAIR